MTARLALVAVVVVLLGFTGGNSISSEDVLFKLRPEIDIMVDALTVASPGDRVALSSAIVGVLSDHFSQGQGRRSNSSLAVGYSFCCKCNRCQRTCKVCGKTCCCKGDQGCRCRSCSNSPDKAFQFEAETYKALTWEDRVKMLLRQKVTEMTQIPENKLHMLDAIVDTYVNFLQ